MSYDLEFEKPLAELERRIQTLQRRGERMRPEEHQQINELRHDLERRTAELYQSLTPWQRVMVARHKMRPYTRDYIRLMTDDFFELRGDRRFGDDRAIQGGLATLDGRTVMILGHHKGRDTKEKQECTFGMAHPEGFRKALRMFKHAERFGIPIVSLIDTAGAYVALEDEERGISQSIAENLMVMANLRTPVLVVVIGEGGSGGALGISVGDRILMMEHAIYTVASPESAASILWRDPSFAANAAENMKITASDLLALDLIEEIIPEPLGGAHRDHAEAAVLVKEAITRNLDQLCAVPLNSLVDQRYARFRKIGADVQSAVPVEALD